ncbi:unnamed protein product [Lactuca virosa]|uniref:Uncharacterized protein n=1 Tax=Lactuca virosa TaxID=75947 RepID=A0AAU9LN88_9ASTR|nr:unnamed protein product [Lactuca virosa]
MIGLLGLLVSMEGDGSWSATSLSEEEHAILHTSDPVDTLEMEDSEDIHPDYTLAEHPSEPVLSPYYIPAGLKLLSS